MAEAPKLMVWSWIAGLAFLIGLFAGPIYYIYCEAYSGKAIGEYDISARGNAYGPVKLALDPDMNPLLLSIRGVADGHDGDDAVHLGFALHDGKTQLLSGSVTFAVEKDGRSVDKSEALGKVSVPAAGDYSFTSAPLSGSTLGRKVKISDLRLTVKRSAWVTSPRSHSSKRGSAGKIGSPAASDDVHPRGRNELLLRSNVASHAASQPAGFLNARQNS